VYLKIEYGTRRVDIHAEFKRATTVTDREALLAMHKVVMDVAEDTIDDEALEDFKKARRQDYIPLIVQEAMIGQDSSDGNIHPEKLTPITRREVEAGRMAPDDDLHEMAVTGETVLILRLR
jgi:hypothetical protein